MDQIIILMIFQIISFFGLAYLISYVKKKGENQASKEDLIPLTKEIEKIKSSLNLSQSISERVYERKSKALLNLFDTCLNLKSRFGYNLDSIIVGEAISVLNSIQIEIENLFKNLSKYYFHCLLYIKKDTELQKSITYLLVAALLYHPTHRELFGQLKVDIVAQGNSYDKKTIENIRTLFANYRRATETYQQKFIEAINKYSEEVAKELNFKVDIFVPLLNINKEG